MGMDMKFIALAVLACLVVAHVEGARPQFGSSRGVSVHGGGLVPSRGERQGGFLSGQPDYDNEEEYDEEYIDDDYDKDDEVKDDDVDYDEGDDDEADDDDFLKPPPRHIRRNGYDSRSDKHNNVRELWRGDTALGVGRSRKASTLSTKMEPYYNEEDDEVIPAPIKRRISLTAPRGLRVQFMDRAEIKDPKTEWDIISRMPVRVNVSNDYRPLTPNGRSNAADWLSSGRRRRSLTRM